MDQSSAGEPHDYSPDTSVVFFCDTGPRRGVGHVMRCVALAEELAGRGRPVVFVADLDSVPWAREQVRSRGFGHVQPLPGPIAVAEQVRATGASYIVVDSYEMPTSFYDEVRSPGTSVLALVDGDPAGRPADVWLDQNIDAEHEAWDVPAGTVRLAGLSYALMRDEIRSARPPEPPAEEQHPTPTVLAIFGGTDTYGVAPAAVRAVAATGLPCSLTVVAATPELAERCAAVPLEAGQSLTVVAPHHDLATSVRSADVVLSAAGTSTWELLCLGSATGLVCVADNQEPSYRRVVDQGLALGLGYRDALPRAGAAGSLRELLGDPGRRAELRRRAWERVDGRGRERVVDAWQRGAGTLGTGHLTH